MRLEQIVQSLDLAVITSGSDLSAGVTGGYASDLMSDVIANAQPGQLWITLQTHLNVVAIASMKETAGVIFIGGRKPGVNVVEKAEEEGVTLLSTDLPAFELIGRLYELGVRGA